VNIAQLSVPGSAGVLAGSLKALAFGRIDAGEDAGAPRGSTAFGIAAIQTGQTIVHENHGLGLTFGA
jgi:hypothetical protein